MVFHSPVGICGGRSRLRRLTVDGLIVQGSPSRNRHFLPLYAGEGNLPPSQTLPDFSLSCLLQQPTTDRQSLHPHRIITCLLRRPSWLSSPCNQCAQPRRPRPRRLNSARIAAQVHTWRAPFVRAHRCVVINTRQHAWNTADEGDQGGKQLTEPNCSSMRQMQV